MKRMGLAMILLVGMCLAVVAVACEEDEEATATPTAPATATVIVSPTVSPPASPSPAAATPTAAPETPTPAATPTPSPTPEAVACPDDDPSFCAFAVRLERAIAEGDAEFFVDNSLTQSILCTAEEAEAGYICGPEEIGEMITGIAFGWEASEGTLVSPADYRNMWIQLFDTDLPAEEDADGSGELRIWGLAYAGSPAEGTPRNIVVTYISDIGEGPERQAISLHCEVADGSWQISSLLQHALVLGSPRDTAVEWRDWP